MLPPVFRILKAAPAVTAIVGAEPRIYRHDAAPQDVDRPYVTWFLVTGTPENELSDVPGMDRIAFQVDCWHQQDGGIEDLAQAVRDAIEPHAHMTAIVVNGYEPETKLYRIGMQFDYWLPR